MDKLVKIIIRTLLPGIFEKDFICLVSYIFVCSETVVLISIEILTELQEHRDTVSKSR